MPDAEHFVVDARLAQPGKLLGRVRVLAHQRVALVLERLLLLLEDVQIAPVPAGQKGSRQQGAGAGGGEGAGERAGQGAEEGAEEKERDVMS